MKPESQKRQILIVGGGVAGASLAIRLAKRNIDVVIVEKDKFPRHKLCGEFVSPECLAHFGALGILDSISDIGGDVIRETRFYSEKGRFLSVPSDWFWNGKRGALGISRSAMDHLLLETARKAGAEVLEETRVTGIEIDERQITSVSLKSEQAETLTIKADLIIDATGRSRVLGKLIEKQKANPKNPKKRIKHIAFKTHLKNVSLEKGICEIYFFRGGYGGLNYVENGIANSCFIINSSVAREYRGDADRILNEVVLKNKRAFGAMKDAKQQFDWLAVSVEKFGRQPLTDIDNMISIGDASAFIDPFTGSGMLMALESSEILADTVSKDLIIPAGGKVKMNFELIHRKAITRRLKFCSLIHRLSFSTRLADLTISVAGLSTGLLERVVSMARPVQNR